MIHDSKFILYFWLYVLIQYLIFSYLDLTLTGHGVGGLIAFASIVFTGVGFAMIMVMRGKR